MAGRSTKRSVRDRVAGNAGGWRACLLGLACLIAFGARAETDSLQRIGVQGTTGAAPGYLPDRACATCHGDLHASFQHVGMARSMQRPHRDGAIEDFRNAEFEHKASARHYRMHWNAAGELSMQRWQLDRKGRRINEIEQRIDWMIGSGQRSRVYVYRDEAGELFQLPIAWYAQGRHWGMAPGYDRSDHNGLGRRIRRECLFCHNAYPEVAEGSDAAWMPQQFPEALPEGIGCQRCHGPGASHVRAVFGEKSLEDIRAAIVNPRKLPPARRDDVCFQCHLLPAVNLIGLRQDGRGDYSFRPGQDLADYLLHVDIEEEGRDAADRFEINHHAYRLQRSACYRVGGLTCIDCHNPHVGLKEDPRLAAADTTCRRCHQPHALEAHASAPAERCTVCHMPKRRTQDVVQVVMTDHGMPRVAPADALATLAEQREPIITDLHWLSLDKAPQGAAAQAWRARTVLKAVPSRDALQALERALRAEPAQQPEPWLDLLNTQLRVGRAGDAAQAAEVLAQRWPGIAAFATVQGTAAAKQGHADAAMQAFDRALSMQPEDAELHLNRAIAAEQSGDREAALAGVREALRLRPNLLSARLALGRLLEALGRPGDAAEAYRAALAWSPHLTRAYAGIVRSLRAAGDGREAKRYLEHARRHSADPEQLDRLIGAAP